MQEKITAVLLDDMPSENEELAHLLRTFHPEVEIIGIFGDVQQALWCIANTPPDVLFLDIRMPEMNGFEFFALLSSLHIQLQCVIVSNYLHEYNKTRLDTIYDLQLEKSVEEEDLKIIVETVSGRKEKGEYTNLEHILDSMGISQKIALPIYSGNIFVCPEDVIFVQANEKTSKVWVKGYDEQPVEVRKLFKELTEILQPAGLFLAHRSYMVNLDYIKELNDNTFEIRLYNGSKDDILILLEHRPLAFQRIKQEIKCKN